MWERVSFTTTHAVLSLLLFALGLRGLYRFGRLFATLEWLINFRRRRRFARAYARVITHPSTGSQRRHATREYFMRSRCDKLFYLVFDRIPREKLERCFTIDSKDILDQAMERGHGVYMAMSHHGPHHVAAMFMALHGYRVAGVRDRAEGGLRRYVQDRFDRLYPEFQRMRVLFADSYPRDIYRCFRDGFVLGSAMDVDRVRHADQKAAEVTIFGEKQLFLTGPLRVAIRCQAPVLQAFIAAEPHFRYRLEIVETLVDPDAVEDEESAVAGAIRTYAANVEKHLRAAPALLTRI